MGKLLAFYYGSEYSTALYKHNIRDPREGGFLCMVSLKGAFVLGDDAPKYKRWSSLRPPLSFLLHTYYTYRIPNVTIPLRQIYIRSDTSSVI